MKNNSNSQGNMNNKNKYNRLSRNKSYSLKYYLFLIPIHSSIIKINKYIIVNINIVNMMSR